MKRKFVKHYDRLIVLLLAMFGLLPGCDDKYGPVMYGQPSADYRVSGVVTDGRNKPIQHIQVVRPYVERMQQDGVTYSTEYGDTAYTDSQGRFDLGEISQWPTGEVKIIFEDIDGLEHGGYFDKKEVVETFTEAERLEKGGEWYKGAFWKKLNITLTKRESAAMYGVPPATAKK